VISIIILTGEPCISYTLRFDSAQVALANVHALIYVQTLVSYQKLCDVYVFLNSGFVRSNNYSDANEQNLDMYVSTGLKSFLQNLLD
jgi:hypothetical protein